MTEVTPHPLKTQGFHHFFILLFYDHPANDVTIMKEGHPEAGIPLLVGGPGWNCTNDVSHVTVLQTAALANYAY